MSISRWNLREGNRNAVSVPGIIPRNYENAHRCLGPKRSSQTVAHRLVMVDLPLRLQYAAVCCSVLQCAAVCCSVSQCVAVCRRMNIHSTPCLLCLRYVLQCVAMCCNVLQFDAVLQCVAVCCSMHNATTTSRLLCLRHVLQCVAV